MAFNYSPKVVTDGLVLYLDAANTKSIVSGSTTWNDLSRRGNNGTLTNNPTFDSQNAGSIVFDGTNDYVIGSGVNLSGSAFTISTWIKPNQTDTRIFFSVGSTTSTRGSIHIRITNSTSILFGMYSDDLTFTVPDLLNNWSHITVSLNTDFTQSSFRNGVFINSRLAGGYFTGGSLWAAGVRLFGSLGEFFSGNISHTLVYNRALTPTEVLQNYNATKGRYGL
jgi:hypothetical protein